MARIAWGVVPGLPHHVTQRGNGRQKMFFSDSDYALYRDLLSASCRKAKVEGRAWVAMPNHGHLILVPRDADGLRAAPRLCRAHSRSRKAQAEGRLKGAPSPNCNGRALLVNHGAAQPERVSDHAYRAQSHGCRRNHG
jgi:putative transposase